MDKTASSTSIENDDEINFLTETCPFRSRSDIQQLLNDCNWQCSGKLSQVDWLELADFETQKTLDILLAEETSSIATPPASPKITNASPPKPKKSVVTYSLTSNKFQNDRPISRSSSRPSSQPSSPRIRSF